MSDSNGLVARLWNCGKVLRDESFDDAENLPVPEMLAAEIVEDLEAALAEFAQIGATLGDTAD
ncbi:MAG TPA: hypothetical protein VGN51_02050 [Acidimicrobiia bacterium]|jgi:type I restriction enzyme M protein